MVDSTFALVVFGLAASMWAASTVVAALRARSRLAGTRVVTCPETKHPASVRFDLTRTLRTALIHQKPEARLIDCSRWAERGPCDQPCVQQAKSPESTVAEIVGRSSVGKQCVLCRKPAVDTRFVGHHIALLSSDGVTTEWREIPPQELPDALRTRRPVCWNCHVSESFRRKYPELVIDR